MLFARRDPDGTLFYYSASDFDGLVDEPYTFATKRGERLSGHFYYYGSKPTGRIIVFDHGMGCGHRPYLSEINLLAKQGYLVFAYDHTGCADSEGESTRGFAGSLADLDSAITTLKSDEAYRGYSISVIGHSWGGYSTLNIAKYHPDITHVVAMSGFISVRQMQKQVVPFFLAPFRGLVYRMEKEANPNYVDADAINTLKNAKASVMIIHSDDDSVVSPKLHYQKMHRALKDNENVTFCLVSGKKHNPNYTANAVKLMDAMHADRTQRKKDNKLGTAEEKQAFINSHDWAAITEQDTALWQTIFDFLER